MSLFFNSSSPPCSPPLLPEIGDFATTVLEMLSCGVSPERGGVNGLPRQIINQADPLLRVVMSGQQVDSQLHRTGATPGELGAVAGEGVTGPVSHLLGPEG